MDEPGPSVADWRRRASAELGGTDPDTLLRTTPDGITLRPLYTAADLAGVEHLGGLPGFDPYVRGVRATMYANRPWTVRQYAGFSSAEESNAFYRANLAAGQTGLSVAFDLATHRGYDSDHPRVEGDVGRAGVAVDSVEDMAILFEGIPLDRTSVSMTMNGAVAPVLACFLVAAEEQGVAPGELRGTIQNDILKEFMVRNTYVYPPAPSMRIVADVIEHGARHLPRFNSISISGYHMHEAGATAHQELAFTIADGLEYLRAALGRGLDVDTVAPRLSFFFAVGMDLFTEVAKLRAARLLWSRVVTPFDPREPASLMMRAHCQTSGVSLTAQDPYNNVVRTAYEALAAVLGGTQSLHTNAFDEALGLPTDASARIARNTQLVLAEETGVARVVDPLGGSYYVERLTAELAARAWALVEEVEALGGMTRAVETGMPKAAIEASAARRQAAVDRGEQVVVGVNRYTAGGSTAGGGDGSDHGDPDGRGDADGRERATGGRDGAGAVDIREIDNAGVRARQVARLARLRAERDEARCQGALARLAEGAAGDANLLARCIDAARARATVGEMSAAMESVFGRHRADARPVTGVYGRAYEGDAAFGALRAAVDGFAAAQGRRPRILVAKLGQDGHDRGAKVIASAFADLGFDVDVGPLFQTPAEVARAARDNDVHAVGVSTQAGAHGTLVPQLLDELRAAGMGDVVVVVGGVVPGPDRAMLRRAGVAAVFGPGTTVVAAAGAVLDLVRARP